VQKNTVSHSFFRERNGVPRFDYFLDCEYFVDKVTYSKENFLRKFNKIKSFYFMFWFRVFFWIRIDFLKVKSYPRMVLLIKKSFYFFDVKLFTDFRKSVEWLPGVWGSCAPCTPSDLGSFKEWTSATPPSKRRQVAGKLRFVRVFRYCSCLKNETNKRMLSLLGIHLLCSIEAQNSDKSEFSCYLPSFGRRSSRGSLV
jgi:hypothetical protein